jgi:hypothetical protein
LLHMSTLNLKSGKAGEIRVNCRVVNGVKWLESWFNFRSREAPAAAGDWPRDLQLLQRDLSS